MMQTLADFAVVVPTLVLANHRFVRSEANLRGLNVGAVVNLILFDADDAPPTGPAGVAHWLHCPVADVPTTSIEWAHGVGAWVDALPPATVLLVHCSQGVSRAPSLCLFLLMTRHGQSLRQAFELIRSVRPVICPSMGFWAGLVALEGVNPTFPAHEYALQVIHEIFPTLARQVIEDYYSRAQQQHPLAEGRAIEPLGYHAIDLLLRDHAEAYKARHGASQHHPFD